MITKDPTHLKGATTLHCEILMSKNKQQFERGIVINNIPQGNVVRHLRYCGIFNDNSMQIHRWILHIKEF